MRPFILCLLLLFSSLLKSQNTIPYPSLWAVVDTVTKDMVYQADSNYHDLPNNTLSKDTSMHIVYENGYPMLHLSGDSFKFSGKLPTVLNLMILFREEAYASEQALWQIHYDSIHSQSLTTNHYHTDKLNILHYNAHEATPKLNTRRIFLKDRISTIESDTLILFQFDSLQFKGQFGEFLIFDTTLTNEQLQGWRTALCLKYGITMIKSDYLNSQGDTMWRYEDNAIFSEGVGAIGRDDAFGLDQIQSRIFGDSLMFCYDSVFALQHEHLKNSVPDKSFTYVGHQGGDCFFVGEHIFIDTLNFCRYDRVWKIYSTQNAPSQLYSRIAVHDTIGWEHCYLFMSKDSTFSTGQIQRILPRIAGDGYIDFNAINVDTSATYITYGYDIAYCVTPLANILYQQSYYNVDNESNEQDSNVEVTSRGDRFLLYPNPTNGIFYISVELKELSDVRLIIYDAAGRKVSQHNYPANEKHYTIQQEILQPGVYYIIIELLNYDERSFLQLIVK